MNKVSSVSDLMKEIEKMDRENSICQFSIPGKGKFTIVLQEEWEASIDKEIENDDELKKMISESQEAYKLGNVKTTEEAIKSLSVKDFQK